MPCRWHHQTHFALLISGVITRQLGHHQGWGKCPSLYHSRKKIRPCRFKEYPLVILLNEFHGISIIIRGIMTSNLLHKYQNSHFDIHLILYKSKRIKQIWHLHSYELLIDLCEIDIFRDQKIVKCQQFHMFTWNFSRFNKMHGWHNAGGSEEGHGEGSI